MSNTGRNYLLDTSLRVKTAEAHGSPKTGLSEDASRKHIATFSRPEIDGLPVQGPLELSTYQHMAQDVHANRALSGQKTPDVNTVALFQREALPSPTLGGSRNQFHEMDVSSAVVMQSTKSTNTVAQQTGSKMVFENKNNDHLHGVE